MSRIRGRTWRLPQLVVVECDAAKAPLISEREWFPGQRIERLPDGGLRLTYPQVPRPDLVYRVLSYCGHLAVRHPPDVIDEIREAARQIVDRHPSHSARSSGTP